MPSIIINEKDETFVPSQLGTDVVFVVGMATDKTDEDYLNKAILFTSISGFKNHIGPTPYQWQSAQDISKPEATGEDSLEEEVEVDTIKFISYFNKTCVNRTNLIYPSEDTFEVTFTYNDETLPKDYTFTDDKSGIAKIPVSELSNYGITLPLTLLGAGYSFTITVTYTRINVWPIADYEPATVTAEEYDTGYLYASELLYAGLPVIYYSFRNINKLPNAQEVSDLYQAMESIFDVVADMGEYSPKYITSGGYPVLGFNGNVLTKKMLDVASGRGDCIALIDHTNKSSRPLTGTGSVYYEVSNLMKNNNYTTISQFGALFTPWASYNFTSFTPSSNQALPGSYAFLISLAQSIKTNANWFAIAGVTRGLVPNLISKSNSYSLLTDEVLTNAIADSYQKDDDVSINAITNIRPYGYTIWGNRTLKDNTANNTEGDIKYTATSFLNLRGLINDVKKTAYTAAKSLMFEQNTDILWINFKSKITPLLDRMTSGQGLSGYKIIKETPTDGDRTKVQAKIILYPVYAVEKFDITVIIRNEDIEVA